MSRKNRLRDIAELAGVGVATVDRVLNERGNVSTRMAERVLNAARQLELKRILPASHHRLLRIGVLLPRPELPLITRMNHEFGRQAERIDRSVIIQRTIVATEDPHILARQITGTRCDAVIAYAPEHPLIHEAIAEIQSRGKPAVTMISDLPNSARLAYAGTDHFAAGRTAAYFMAKMMRMPAPILVLCNHFGFQSHEDRVRGFRDGLAHYAPDLDITEVIEGGDDSVRSEALLRDSFKKCREIAGFYNVGAANDACANALSAGILSRPPIFIGHELSHETRPMLRDGLMTLAIDQNPEHQARFAVDVLLHHFGYTEQKWLTPPYVSNVSFRIFSPENTVTFSGPARGHD